MKFIIPKGARLLISIFLGSLLSELIFISVGDPNRQKGNLEHIFPIFCMAIMYQIFTFLVNRNRVVLSVIPNNNEAEEALEIYSKTPILIFSIFFPPVFAGFLLRQNLIELKKKNVANVIVFISIIITFLSFVIINRIVGHPSLWPNLFNFACSTILTQYVFNKYFKNGNYIYKKIWTPLIIVLSIIVTLVVINVLLK